MTHLPGKQALASFWRRPRSVSLGLTLPVLVGSLLISAPRLAAETATGKLAVASENAQGTRAALAIMKAGGNAVDAAVTAALIGGVASPTSSGIGGGGFAVVWDAAKGEPFVLDFREHAPALVKAELFEKRPLLPKDVGQLTGVPGEVAGLYELHSRYGKRPWADVVAPAELLAKNGFQIEPHLANMLAKSEGLKADRGISRVFFPGGKAASLGRVVKNTALGQTLAQIGKFGPRAFYEGAVAKDIVESSKTIGGVLTLDELKNYRPIARAPLRVQWAGYEVLTMPPPSAGGVMLAQTLRLFSRETLTRLKHGSGLYHHVLAEALRGSIADRLRFIGDPAFVPDPAASLLSKEWLEQRARRISVDRTHRLPRFAERSGGTHHLVTADAIGNMVALTTTVNRLFGVKTTTRQTGIVLNDELDDFNERSDVEGLGLAESPNRPRPGARPVSSMTPTIVLKDRRAVLGLGGSGGPTIATNVTQVTLAILGFQMTPAEALAMRRFYVFNGGPSTLLVEAGTPDAVRADLAWRGEVVKDMPFSTSAVQVVSVGASGDKLAASDPRKHGHALAE